MVNGRVKGAAVLLAVFALGSVAGGGGAYAWLRRDDVNGVEERGLRSPRRLRALERSLDLTAAQRERVGAILAQSGDERRRLAQEMFERCGEGLRTQHDAVSAQIRAVLTPEQQARFDAIDAQQRERFPFGGGGGGRRRGPREPGGL